MESDTLIVPRTKNRRNQNDFAARKKTESSFLDCSSSVTDCYGGAESSILLRTWRRCATREWLQSLPIANAQNCWGHSDENPCECCFDVQIPCTAILNSLVLEPNSGPIRCLDQVLPLRLPAHGSNVRHPVLYGWLLTEAASLASVILRIWPSPHRD